MRLPPFSNGSYGAPVALGSGFPYPQAVAVDTAGNVFVADKYNNALREIPFANGSYGAPVTVGSGFHFPHSVALDSLGRVYAGDIAAISVFLP
jgi:DNA-binding beta-propeller fold protein YncE